jgi:hypothetical protein
MSSARTMAHLISPLRWLRNGPHCLVRRRERPNLRPTPAIDLSKATRLIVRAMSAELASSNSKQVRYN